MKKINFEFLLPFSICLWVAYTLYTVIITTCDFSHVRYITWQQAKNQSTAYSSLRSTTVTYNFVKDNIRISRKYPGLLEGVNVWLWDIDKEKNEINISFYIREKDYRRIKNNEIRYRRDIFGGKLNELESIPFFGLRKIDCNSSNLLLWMEIGVLKCKAAAPTRVWVDASTKFSIENHKTLTLSSTMMCPAEGGTITPKETVWEAWGSAALTNLGHVANFAFGFLAGRGAVGMVGGAAGATTAAGATGLR